MTFNVVFSILKLGCMYRLLYKHGIHSLGSIHKKKAHMQPIIIPTQAKHLLQRATAGEGEISENK
jgi:hypothetical protein